MSILERTNSTPLLLNNGTRLADRYLIQESISQSATSAVYRARDLHFPNVTKLVAVKEFHNPAPDKNSRQANFEGFERQVNLMATLSHPALPGILDYFIRDKQAYLVLEFVNGQTLSEVMQSSNGGLTPDQVVPWAIAISELLQYLHGHQPEPVYVKDLNPANILLDQHSQLLLADFGLAAYFQADPKNTFSRSAGFIAPEVSRT